MKCEMAKDLIILYAEDLCSSETARELEVHLAQCPECVKQLEHYKRELLEQKKQAQNRNNVENVVALKPMKKVKKKLTIGKVKIGILSFILLVIVGFLGVLSFGQATNACISFSVVSDVIKVESACDALAEGDIKPFMDLLAFRMEDRYVINGTKEFEDLEAYRASVESGIYNAYEYYFKDRNIKVKVQEVFQVPYREAEVADVAMTGIVIDFYEGNELLYEMEFCKVSANKFVVYEAPKNEAPGFVTQMLPYDDIVLDINLKYATRTNYNRFVSGEEKRVSAGLALGITKAGTDEEKNLFQQQILGKTQELCDKGWYFKDVLFSADEYDKEADKWIYKVWFLIEEQSSGKVFMMEQRFHYYDKRLYVIEGETAAILAADGAIPEEIERRIVELFR